MNFIPIRIQQKVPQDRNKRYSSYDSFNRIAVILLKIWTYSSGAEEYVHIFCIAKHVAVNRVNSNHS